MFNQTEEIQKIILKHCGDIDSFDDFEQTMKEIDDEVESAWNSGSLNAQG